MSTRFYALLVILIVALLIPLPALGQATAAPAAVTPEVYSAPSIKTQSPLVSKLQSSLYELAILAANAQWEQVQELAARYGIPLLNREARIVVEAEDSAAGNLAAALQALGARVEARHDTRVQALVPLSSLLTLAQTPGLRLARLPYHCMPVAFTGEGVPLIDADDWQAEGYRGSGVKVAVLDIGFQGYASLVQSGELPSNVTARSFRSDGDIEAGEVHGAACGEIIHDVAPGARLYLLNFDTDVEFANAIDWIIAQGIDVVSCSIIWFGAGTTDGTGPVCDLVNEARDHGVFWAQSAGNSAGRHWEGDWADADNDGWHDFSPTDESQTISISTGATLWAALTWDEPWGGAANDYDLLLYNSSGTVVAQSADAQNGAGDPSEFLQYTPFFLGGTYELKIKRNHSTRNVRLDLYTDPQTPEYRVTESSLCVPADAAGAVAAGAVSCRSGVQDIIESFSSRGPSNDGRLKPNVVAPDGVTSIAYDDSFYGTSAAAPHLAGAAALVRGAFPSYTVTDTVGYLTERSADLGAAGPDNTFGYGRIALRVPPIPPTPTPTPLPSPTPTLTPVPNRAPTAGTITPSSGSAKAGVWREFTTTWSDPDGWQDLVSCQFHIGATTAQANNVYLVYLPESNTIKLRDDTGTAWKTRKLGVGSTVGNAQATVDVAKIVISHPDAQTTQVKWTIAFKAAFAGTKNTYLKVKDAAGAGANWAAKGKWTIQK